MELHKIFQSAFANAYNYASRRKNMKSAIIVSRNNSSSSTSTSNTSCSNEENKNDNDNDYEMMVVPREEVIRYIADSLIKVGANYDDAVIVGEHLFTADYRGHFSHGMNRMEMYVKDVINKLTDPKGKPEVITDFHVSMINKQYAEQLQFLHGNVRSFVYQKKKSKNPKISQAVATVDGKNGFGQVIGNFSMNLAIKKAKEYGIGMVSCRGSNHYGIAGYYSLLAMRENLIGFSCTNTSPLMAPTGSKTAALGTNPISLGAPGSNGDEFLLDMATTCVALGKIELAIRKGDSIPSGWALGEDGKPTSDGKVALKTACLMPLGGEEENSGYKGFGLAFMVEILSGILSGSNFGPNIRKWDSASDMEIANLGHCFVAIDPEKFIPGWKNRLDVLLKQIRNLPKAGDKNVLVPGDPERNHMRKVDQEGGISYHINQLKDSEKFATKLGVQPMKLVRRKISGKL